MNHEDSVSFVRLARKFFRSDLWKESREFSRAEAWLDMIATATFAPETRLVEGRCVSLQRGELVASLRYLAQRWSWSKSKVDRFLGMLVEAERATKRDANGTGVSVILLCNYDAYNPTRDKLGTGTSPPTGTPAGQARDKVEEGEEPENGKNLKAGTVAREGEGERPSWEEVQFHATRIGLAEWKARDWFDEMHAIGWIDYQHRPVQAWKSMLNRVRTKWEADGRPSAPPTRQRVDGGRSLSPLDIRTIIGAKEKKADALKSKHSSLTSTGHTWSNQKAFEEWRGIRKEIRDLNDRLSNLA